MALPSEVPADQFENSIAEPIRGEYTLSEDGATYILDVTEVNGRGLAETAKLLSSSRSARQERDTARRELAELRGQFDGVDPNEISTMRGELETLRAAGTGSAEEIQQLRTEYDNRLTQERDRIATEFGEQVQSTQGERDAAIRQLDGFMIESAATKAILAKDPQASVQLLMPAIKERVRVVGDAGNRTIEVVDPQNPEAGLMKVVDSNFVAAGIGDVVNSLFNDSVYGRAFSAASGSGANPSAPSGNGGIVSVDIFKYGSPSFSTSEQIKLKKASAAEYTKLRQEAIRLGYLQPR